MIKIAINGFGRIGRMFFRVAFDSLELEIVAINDLSDLENLIYLLKYDSVYRKWERETETRERNGQKYLIIAGNPPSPKASEGLQKEILFLQEKDPTKLPWKDLDVDVVVESTGIFETYEKSKAHLDAGAKRVVISAPAKDEDGELGKTILLGINENEFKNCKISSNGSCTTNSAHPVMQILNETIGIKKAMLTTIHSYTATQKLVDAPDKGDWRRGRAAAQNIVPSTTGAAISVTRAVKELKGFFDGVAMRVPTISGSLSDITFLAKNKTTAEEINNIFMKAEKDSRWQEILKTTSEALVSSDIIGEPYAAIIDLKFTKVVDGDLVKVLAWYDNEMGYAHMLAKHVIKAGQTL